MFGVGGISAERRKLLAQAEDGLLERPVAQLGNIAFEAKRAHAREPLFVLFDALMLQGDLGSGEAQRRLDLPPALLEFRALAVQPLLLGDALVRRQLLFPLEALRCFVGRRASSGEDAG